MGDVSRKPAILVVTGLVAEAQIAASASVKTLCGGGNSIALDKALVAALDADIAGILSFGIAGGLSPDIAVGTVILCEGVMAGGTRYSADPAWLARLARKLPAAKRGDILGVDAPAVNAAEKARHFAKSGALIVDMESHLVARLAAERGIPFAALRVTSDPAHRALPPAALVGMRADGTPDISAVLRSLAGNPLQLPALIRTAFEAAKAMRNLQKSRQLLDGGFEFWNL